jgi:hypothetical protein
MMKSISISVASKVACLGVGLLALAGCQQSQKDPLSYDSISGDLTPELQGTVERPVDIDRHLAVIDNQNLRMASDDLGRIWYTTGPSMLSPFPITSMSGIPR